MSSLLDSLPEALTELEWSVLMPAVLSVAAMAALSKGLRNRTLSAWFFGLPGVILHELAHWLTAFLLFARPLRFRPWPSRTDDGRWALGSVQVRRLTFLNAAPIGLAPLALIPLGVYLLQVFPQQWPISSPWYWAAAYVTAMCFTDAWPSRADQKAAWRSWPIALVLLGYWGLVTAQAFRTDPTPEAPEAPRSQEEDPRPIMETFR